MSNMDVIKAPPLVAADLSESDAKLLYQQAVEAHQQGDYPSAIAAYQRALSFFQQIDKPSSVWKVLYALGLSYSADNQYALAIEHHEEALAIQQQLDAPDQSAPVLVDLGLAYTQVGKHPEALESYRRAIALLQESDDELSKGRALFNMGLTYDNLSNYEKALEHYQQALTIFVEIGNQNEEGRALANIAKVYGNISDFPNAFDYAQQALRLFEGTGNLSEQSRVLHNLGFDQFQQADFAEALSFLEQALSIRQTTNDLPSQGRTLESIGEVYVAQNDYERATATLNQALSIVEDGEDAKFLGRILNHLGDVYRLQGEFVLAEEHYERAIVVSADIGDRRGEAITWQNLGRLFTVQESAETAVVFYKKSINLTETIRADIETLPVSQREAYAVLVGERYRELADLLLQQNRILEAQQVLELLKVEELREFTRATYRNGQLQYDPIEQPIVEAHGSLISLGVEIAACGSTCAQSLYDQQMKLEAGFDETVKTFESTIRTNRAEDDVFYDPTSLASDALDIVNAQDGTVLIYPVVLEDRLWLLWTATGGVVGKVEVPDANQVALSRAVGQFRELLTKNDAQSLAELKQVGQQLHGWLIEPLSEELNKNNIQQLVFAQDRATRYLPMAALYDGEQFLIETYTVSTVLSAALTDTTDRLGEVETANTLALGLDQSFPGFSALPNVREELNAVVKTDAEDTSGIYPGSVFMNDDFTFATLSEQVRRHRILHIATHAEFVPIIKDASYILSGTGEQLTIDQLGSLDTQFNNLHLVVLSACRTALGGESLDATENPPVISYFLGKNKAEAVLATLWRVDDAGTSLLMQRFYKLMATGDLTKAEALQQAQLSLLNQEDTLDQRFVNLGLQRGLANINAPASTPTTLEHPYYWAPFILIGNSL